MFFTCKADYVAYALLSRFETVTEPERDVVQYILQLVPCYDTATGKLRMTRDAHILAQIYLAQLRVLAGWHSYVHEGSLEDPAVRSSCSAERGRNTLVRHLSTDEYEDILESMHEAEALLLLDIVALNTLVKRWTASHLELKYQWRTDPIDGGNEWYYGYVLPVPFRIEDVVTPLPYPVKEEWGACVGRDGDGDSFELVDCEEAEEINGKAGRRKLRKTQKQREVVGKVAELGQPGKQTYVTLPLMTKGMVLSTSWSSTESDMWTTVKEPEAKADETKREKFPGAGKTKGGARHSLKTLLRLG